MFTRQVLLLFEPVPSQPSFSFYLFFFWLLYLLFIKFLNLLKELHKRILHLCVILSLGTYCGWKMKLKVMSEERVGTKSDPMAQEVWRQKE
jgi:hypothetical protein